ncbi:DoxX family protein [Chitinophaga sedimenti]|uniref:DoxX family protein n=1 Tax=Chitinophaga sedimenti TaxID=2033606 RepID=UPI002003D780|nr:DoxX family protein [Chitinophaga sedimenti]MCK7556065.1 DoxX family protein [Chitinophaga sedimenti]
MAKTFAQTLLGRPGYTNGISFALLVLRLVVGVAFLYHGWGKIQTPLSWSPPESPLMIPAIFQMLAAVAEFGGGIALILGFITPIAAFGLMVTMGVAIYMHAVIFQQPFVDMKGGPSFELALVYFAIALLLLVSGPGKFAVDYRLFAPKTTRH